MPKLPRHNSYKFIQLGFYKVIGSGILSQAQLYFVLDPWRSGWIRHELTRDLWTRLDIMKLTSDNKSG